MTQRSKKTQRKILEKKEIIEIVLFGIIAN
jgi:hypothetical protein